MKKSYQIVLLLGGAFTLGLAAGHGFTLQEGLAQGFSSIISKDNTAKKPDEPPGYKGLIPGALPKDAPATPKARAPEQAERAPSPLDRKPSEPLVRRPASARPADMSMLPGYTPPLRTPKTIDEVMLPAQPLPVDRKIQARDIPPDLMKGISTLLSPEQKKLLARPRPMKDGLLPRDAAMQENIESMFRLLDNPKASKNERQANVEQARKKIEDYISFLRLQDEMPQDVYQAMGVPDNYTRDTRTSTKNALTHAEAALQRISAYEKQP